MTDHAARLREGAMMSGEPDYAARLRRRHRSEMRFRFYGLLSIALAGVILVILVGSIVLKGYSAFWQTHVRLDFAISAEQVDIDNLRETNWDGQVKATLRDMAPEVTGRRDKRKLYRFVSPNAGYDLRDAIAADPGLLGTGFSLWVKASDDIDMLTKGHLDRTLPESDRRVSDLEVGWYDRFVGEGRIELRFNLDFFTTADSREPEEAGIQGALMGSFLTLLVTLALSFPVGVMAAVYLEEFAPKNRWTDIIEANINNLAAVPSIVFGLLGLAVVISLFGVPRSAPLAGGIVLALMTLPTIIIASRAALKAVPPSIREAATGLGASPHQVVIHHVLPLAMPGILTGTIIGLAQALGESAPLLMIGMVAFIVDTPTGFTDPATVLPVQIYIWADSPERAFVEKTSAAIMVLLAFLACMNATAVWLRRKFERRW